MWSPFKSKEKTDAEREAGRLNQSTNNPQFDATLSEIAQRSRGRAIPPPIILSTAANAEVRAREIGANLQLVRAKLNAAEQAERLDIKLDAQVAAQSPQNEKERVAIKTQLSAQHAASERQKSDFAFQRDTLRPYIEDITAPDRDRVQVLEEGMAALSVNTLSRADMERFFIDHSVAPTEITAALNNSEVRELLQTQLGLLQKQDAELQLQRTQQETLAAFKGGELLFGGLVTAGQSLGSPALVTAGKTGMLAMQMAIGIEMLSGATAAVGAMSMLTPVGLIFGATMGFMSLLTSNEEEPSNQLVTMISSLSTQLDAHMKDMHQRFDGVFAGMEQLAGMTQQLKQQVQRVIELQIATYQLIEQSFHIMHHKMHDLRAENRANFNDLYSGIQYLTRVGELKELKEYKADIIREIDAIKALDVERSESNRALMITSFSYLITRITKEIASSAWNGKDEYDLLENTEQRSQYLLSRFKSGDFALGPLANIAEEITGTQLQTVGIDKDILPANALWELAIAGFLEIAQHSSLQDYDCRASLVVMEKQAENARKFIEHIGNNKVLFDKLLARHVEYCHEFQFLICELVAGKSYKGQPGNPKKRDSLGAYFAHGEPRVAIDAIGRKIDLNMILLRQFAKLAGLTQNNRDAIDALSTSQTLLRQSFCLTTRSPLIEKVDHARNYSGEDNYVPDVYSGFEGIGAKLVDGKIVHLVVSTNVDSTRLKMSVGQYNVHTHQSSRGFGHDTAARRGLVSPIPIRHKKPHTHRRHCSDGPTLDACTAWNFSQSWRSDDTHPVNRYPTAKDPHFVVMTGGYVAMFNTKIHKANQANPAAFINPWLMCNNGNTPAAFQAPIQRQVQVTKTLLPVIVQDRLVANVLDWQSSPTHVLLNFQAFCLLERKWLQRQQNARNCPFPEPSYAIPIPKSALTPNQLFVQNIDNNRYSVTPTFVIGLAVTRKNRIFLRLLQKILPSPRYPNNQWYTKPWSISEWGNGYNIPCEKISQLKSAVIGVNGDPTLCVVASLRVTEEINKLVFFTKSVQDLKFPHAGNRDFTVCEYILPPIQAIPDLQAMKVLQYKMGDREYLLVTIVGSDPLRHALVFCFDPHTTKVVQLADGPPIFKKMPRFSSAQKRAPGHVPMDNSYSVNISYHKKIATLHFTVPELAGTAEHPTWHMNNTPYKLTALVKASFKASNIAIAIPSASSAAALSLLRIQLLATAQRTRLEGQIQARPAVPLRARPWDEGKSDDSDDDSEESKHESDDDGRAPLPKTGVNLQAELAKRDAEIKALTKAQTKTNRLLEQMMGMMQGRPGYTPSYAAQSASSTSSSRCSSQPGRVVHQRASVPF